MFGLDGAATATWSQRLWGFVCYLGPLVAVPYWLKRDDPFVGFHARQGVRGFLVVVLSTVVIAGVPLVVLAFASVDPTWIVLPPALLFVVLMLVWVIAVVEVLAGHKWHAPIIGSRVEAEMLAHEEEARYRREHSPAKSIVSAEADLAPVAKG